MRVSILGMGTMRLPIAAVRPEFSKAVALMHHAMERGINFFDVGDFYCHGHCEKAFSRALASMPSDQIILSAKNSSHQNRAPQWLHQLDHTLKAFKRKSLYVYFLHHLSLSDWEDYFLANGCVDQVVDARKRGLFQYLGFSSHDTPQNVERLLDTDLFDAVILPFNLLNRHYESVMRRAADKGLGVLAMNPLVAGALTSSALYTAPFSAWSPAELASQALNYVLSQPFIHCALSGMESAGIIDANVQTVMQPRLSAAEIDRMNAIISRDRARRYIPCTACGYCLPCTQGIDIAAVIEILNQYSLLQGENLYHRDYALLGVPAECCIACGQCVEKCPQKLNIPALMTRAAELFGE